MRFIIIIALALISSLTYGRKLQGYVKDSKTNEGVPFATVYIAELQEGDIADENGFFELKELPKGSFSIEVSSLNYNKVVEKVNLLSSDNITIFLEQQHFTMEEVIVLSTLDNRLDKENIMNVTAKSISSLRELAPTSLADGLTNIAGVSNLSTGAGIGKPVIRGLSGNRVITYTQGVRLENQQWGQEHGLGVTQLGVEQVEVIKGASSLLYGADALGGVLFFVDERFANQNSIEGRARTMYHSNTLGSQNDLAFKISKDRFHFNVFGGYNSHIDYELPNGKRATNSRFDEKIAKTAISYHVGNWFPILKYSYSENTYGITEELSDIVSKSRTPELPFQENNTHIVSLENNIYFNNNSKINFIVGYTGNTLKEYEDEHHHDDIEDEHHHEEEVPALDMHLQSLTYNFRWYTPEMNGLKIITGLQGMWQENTNRGEEELIPDTRTLDLGLFSTALYELNNRTEIQGGIRYDFRDIETEEKEGDNFNEFYQSINFSLGAIHNFNEHFITKFNLSSGFRAPHTSELLSDGVHHGTNRYERGNENLKVEQNFQLDIFLGYGNEHVDININPFFNHINNYIYLAPTGEVELDNPVYDYKQQNAKLYGGEAGFHFHPHPLDWLHVESDLSMVFGDGSDGSSLPLIPSNKINSSIRFDILGKHKKNNLNVFLQHIYSFEQNRVSEFETATPAYQVFNTGINGTIHLGKQPIEIQAGVKNIFNEEYIDHLSRFKDLEISNMGRNFYVGINIPIKNSL